ncbi:hypothetical protein BGW80DRAFT_128295 [Lactifluus volemus]|nr:hypothetical protein BGW80DRAFT_128295 [Lactifluus volemus]
MTMTSNLEQTPVLPDDILVDGFITQTFNPGDTNTYFTLLLRPGTPNFLHFYEIQYWLGAWYIRYNPHFMRPLSPGTPIQNGWVRLDFRASTTPGTVLPQVRWFPENPADFRRFVIDAVLQFPIFFVNQTGVVGFHLEDILQGSEQDLARDLQNGNGQAPLGGRTTTHIRINWPGYPTWRRQIPTQDETHAHNPITLTRFMRHVGTSVNNFLRLCEANNHVPNTPWIIGQHHGGITRRQVRVIGAVHVSAGSWQPIIQLTEYVIWTHT